MGWLLRHLWTAILNEIELLAPCKWWLAYSIGRHGSTPGTSMLVGRPLIKVRSLSLHVTLILLRRHLVAELVLLLRPELLTSLRATLMASEWLPGLGVLMACVPTVLVTRLEMGLVLLSLVLMVSLSFKLLKRVHGKNNLH